MNSLKNGESMWQMAIVTLTSWEAHQKWKLREQTLPGRDQWSFITSGTNEWYQMVTVKPLILKRVFIVNIK